MSFFDDAFSTARTVGKTVGKRTEEIIIISKKKLSAVEYENKLESLYEDLGKEYYSVLKGSEIDTEKQNEKVKEIDMITLELEQIKAEISDLLKNR